MCQLFVSTGLLSLVACSASMLTYFFMQSRNKYKSTNLQGFDCYQLEKDVVSIENAEEFRSEYDEGNLHVKYYFQRLPAKQSLQNSRYFYDFMNRRRSVRMFDANAIPKLEIIEYCVKTACTGCIIFFAMFFTHKAQHTTHNSTEWRTSSTMAFCDCKKCKYKEKN